MPELPEVETVARQLAPLITGRTLLRLELLDPRLQLDEATLAGLRGRSIGEVTRHGKQVVLRFDPSAPAELASGPAWLCVHLRMTGRLLWHAVPPAAPTPRALRARLVLDGGELQFCDVRRFGTLRLVTHPAELDGEGLEPLSPSLTDRALAALLRGSGQELKPWLLRQDRLVGIGNIYASEICAAAGLAPDRCAGTLTAAEVRRLRRAVVDVLRRAVECCGTTFSDFQDAHGTAGRFQELLQVYGRAGQPCRRCGAPVRRSVQQGRSTFSCPACQPR